MANNGDELLTTTLEFAGPGTAEVIAIGNFHKTLPHNMFGEVDPAAYEVFKLVAATGGDYEAVPSGYTGVTTPPQAGFLPGRDPKTSDKLNNPQAARQLDRLTANGGTAYGMPAAPSVRSRSTAAEMTELQWMAILRDVPFSSFPSSSRAAQATNDLRREFGAALDAAEPGGLQLGRDLPATSSKTLDLRLETLFRCGLPGESVGPLTSQFFLHDVAYGAQVIEQKVRPYAPGRDFLTDHGSWLRAQNSGRDEWGHGYADDNDFILDPTLEGPGGPRRLSTMRDLARFVNKDALHQAYFNAALLCLNWKVPLDRGNPYRALTRQAGFGTFGGPDILTRVSEVASRALAIVWRQKWEVHRRLRPEAYGGLMQLQANGIPVGGSTVTRDYGLPAEVFATRASTRIRTQGLNGNHAFYLPMAFTAGSPPHPSYGAGHATVAGACVTVLKAWFDEKTTLNSVLGGSAVSHPLGAAALPTENPVAISETDAAGVLQPYGGSDASDLTIEGELNKIACNVAMGRSMGGVHWRSDNTRSLRLGEQIASEMLRSESLAYAERISPAGRPPYWSFRSFDGHDVLICDGRVIVNGVDVDPKAQPL